MASLIINNNKWLLKACGYKVAQLSAWLCLIWTKLYMSHYATGNGLLHNEEGVSLSPWIISFLPSCGCEAGVEHNWLACYENRQTSDRWISEALPKRLVWTDYNEEKRIKEEGAYNKERREEKRQRHRKTDRQGKRERGRHCKLTQILFVYQLELLQRHSILSQQLLSVLHMMYLHHEAGPRSS